MNKMIIAIDFDCTIVHYDQWRGIDVFGEPLDGAVEAIQKMKEAGHRIIIFTCREPTDKLRAFLNEHKIPFDAINENPWTFMADNDRTIKRKIPADVYIDDKALTFNGDWADTLEKALVFESWLAPKDLIDDEGKCEICNGREHGGYYCDHPKMATYSDMDCPDYENFGEKYGECQPCPHWKMCDCDKQVNK